MRWYPGGLRPAEAAKLAAEYRGNFAELDRLHNKRRGWARHQLTAHGYELDPDGPGLIRRDGQGSVSSPAEERQGLVSPPPAKQQAPAPAVAKNPDGPLVIVSDLHYPDHDGRAWGCVLQALALLEPSAVICAGDILEVESANGHTSKKLGGDRRHDDLLAAIQSEARDGLRDVVIPLTQAGSGAALYWLNGNHEHRAERALAKHGLHTTWALSTMLELAARGWQVEDRPYARLDLAGWLIQHGDEPCPSGSGLYAARWRALTYQRNVIFGHLHAFSANTVPSAAGPVTAIGNPCLCDVERAREWAGTSRHRWSHGFTILRRSGTGAPALAESVPIRDGRCWVNGKLVKG